QRLVEGASSLELYRQQFGTLLNDMKAGRAVFKAIQKFALLSPLTLRETLEGTKALMSFGHSFGAIIKKNTGLLANMTKATIFSGKSMVQTIEALEKLRSGTLIQRSLTPVRITPDFFRRAGLKMQGKRPVLADTNPAELYKRVMIQIRKEYVKFKPEKLMQTQIANIIDYWDIMWMNLGDATRGGIETILKMVTGFLEKLSEFAASPAVKKAFDDLFDNVLIPMGEKANDILDDLIKYLNENPDGLSKAVRVLTTSLKAMVAVFVGSNILAVLASLGIVGASGAGMVAQIGAGLGKQGTIIHNVAKGTKLQAMMRGTPGVMLAGTDLQKGWGQIGRYMTAFAKNVVKMLPWIVLAAGFAIGLVRQWENLSKNIGRIWDAIIE
ncbi:hypothetical protein LCGC14_2917260, partial [marine sediment metagenome]